MNTDLIIPAPLVQQFENKAPRGEALDLGSGRGNNAIFLAKQGFLVTAVEIREELAEIIKKGAEENQVNLEVVCQDIKNFPIEEGKYSFISAMNSLNFFSKKEFYEIIEKIKKGLIKEGICVASLFTIDDPLFEEIKTKATAEDDGSFHDNKGKKWYFPKPNELQEIFEKDFTILFYVEAMVEDKGHPNKLMPHKHAVVRIAVKKE